MDNFSAGTVSSSTSRRRTYQPVVQRHDLLFRLAIPTCRPPIPTMPKNWSASRWNRWTLSIGITGRLESESVDDFDWNRWTTCPGIRSYFRNRVQGMGIQEVLTAARSPWQNPFAERLIGSIRRECLNHVVML